jgi:hypothetical protein
MKTNYNGWANYETWSVAVIIQNDEELWGYVVGLYNDTSTTYDLAQAIKEWVSEDERFGVSKVTEGSNLASSLTQAAMEEVNWYNIADCFATTLHREEADKRAE